MLRLRILSPIPLALLDRALAEQENFGNFKADRAERLGPVAALVARLAECGDDWPLYRLTAAGCVLASQARAAIDPPGPYPHDGECDDDCCQAFCDCDCHDDGKGRCIVSLRANMKNRKLPRILDTDTGAVVAVRIKGAWADPCGGLFSPEQVETFDRMAAAPNPGPNRDGSHPWDLIFIAHHDGTFTCGPCTPDGVDPGDDDVQVWEVGSHGWTAPVVCRACRKSIEVYVDGEGAGPVDETRHEAHRDPGPAGAERIGAS